MSKKCRASACAWFCPRVSSKSPGSGPGRRKPTATAKIPAWAFTAARSDEQFFADYTEPGETGNKADVRWIALRKGGIGLLAVGMPLLSANALHYTAEDLNAGKHAFELPHRDFISLNLDLKQQGVGGDNSWGAWPHDEFLIPVQSNTRIQLPVASVWPRGRSGEIGARDYWRQRGEIAIESSKSQGPSSRETSSTKRQIPRRAVFAGLATWSLEPWSLWSLDAWTLGAWNFPRLPTRKGDTPILTASRRFTIVARNRRFRGCAPTRRTRRRSKVNTNN